MASDSRTNRKITDLDARVKERFTEVNNRLHCTLCTYNTDRSSDIRRHIEGKHLQLRPFQCQTCPKAFAQKTQLETHERTHTGDKPHQCRGCGTGFADVSACGRHEKSCRHTNITTRREPMRKPNSRPQSSAGSTSTTSFPSTPTNMPQAPVADFNFLQPLPQSELAFLDQGPVALGQYPAFTAPQSQAPLPYYTHAAPPQASFSNFNAQYAPAVQQMPSQPPAVPEDSTWDESLFQILANYGDPNTIINDQQPLLQVDDEMLALIDQMEV